MVLTPSEAKAFYDRFGKKQDNQGFYEERALDDLINHAGFHEARNVFEFGCGTGKFAACLLAKHLPSSAKYSGCDVSSTMVAIAEQRLADYRQRTKVAQSDGFVHFPIADNSVDRVISTYVLDLLSGDDIKLFFADACRVLVPGGKLCLVGLSAGVTLPSHIVSFLWNTVFHMRPSLVGGCRPIHLEFYVDREHWWMEYRNVVTQCAVSSEVLVLKKSRLKRENRSGT